MPSRTNGYLFIVVGSILWGCNGPATRLALDAGIGPVQLAGWRVVASALVLCGGVAIVRRSDLRVGRRAALPIIAFGLVGVSLSQLVYIQTIERLDVALAVALVYTGPLWVAVWNQVVEHVGQPRLVWVAMVVAIAGVAVAVLGRAGGIGRVSLVGILLGVCTAFAYAAQLKLGARLPADVGAVSRTGLAMAVGAPLWLLVPAVRAIPQDALGASAPLTAHPGWNVPVFAVVLYVIIGGTVLPYLLLVLGVARVGATAAGVTGTIEPLVAASVAWVVLGQSLTLVQVAAIAVVLGAVGAAERMRVAHTASRSDEEAA